MVENAGKAAKNTALVAGGAGFVGSHLCAELLAQGHRVICLDSFATGVEDNILPLCEFREFRMIRGDVRDPVVVNEPIDWVFNLASPASPPHYQADPVHTMLTNVVGTAHLLDLAARHGARFVQASTSEIYGDPEAHPQPEEYLGRVNCTGPRACYDEGKRAAEALCFDYARAGRVDMRLARIFNTYGPRMRPDDGRVVSNFLVQALRGEDITVYGQGRQTRSFCYVSDLVVGLIALMEVARPPRTAINLGNPQEFTILELARQVQELVPGRSRLIFRPLPQDDPTRRRPDISRARELLGWAPVVTLKEGLPQTAAWFAAAVGRAPSPSLRPAAAFLGASR